MMLNAASAAAWSIYVQAEVVELVTGVTVTAGAGVIVNVAECVVVV
ncbi:MAG: hypothetical protein V9F01_07925 [Chitinophagaceae bacterium]